MYGPPGIAYVYLVYGMYDCLNIVTEPAGSPAALLIRAVEPLEGIDVMRDARHEHARTRRRKARGPSDLAEARIASGPGLVTAAFSIDRSMTGVDLLDPVSALRIEAAPAGEPGSDVVATPRVGIAYAGSPWTEAPWRFAIRDHPSVSGRRGPAARPRPSGTASGRR